MLTKVASSILKSGLLALYPVVAEITNKILNVSKSGELKQVLLILYESIPYPTKENTCFDPLPSSKRYAYFASILYNIAELVCNLARYCCCAFSTLGCRYRSEPIYRCDLVIGFVSEEFLQENNNICTIDLKEKILERSVVLIKRKDQSLSMASKKLERMILEQKSI